MLSFSPDMVISSYVVLQVEGPRETADLALLAAVGIGARHGKMSMESKAVLVNVTIKKNPKRTTSEFFNHFHFF